jgi:hypothetical protein
VPVTESTTHTVTETTKNRITLTTTTTTSTTATTILSSSEPSSTTSSSASKMTSPATDMSSTTNQSSLLMFDQYFDPINEKMIIFKVCGVPSIKPKMTKQIKIVNGVEVIPNSWPW